MRGERLVERPARVAPVVAIVALAVVLAWHERGSTAAGDWLSAAVLAGLALAAVLLSGASRLPPRPVVAGVLGLVALAGWTVASALWAPLPSLARDEGLLALLYAAVLALPALALRAAADRVAALAVVALGAATLAPATALRILASGEPLTFFWDGRLNAPISYANANGALFALAVWPGVCLVAARALPWAVRAGALGAAAAGLAGWLATQSKGAGIGLAVASAVVLAVAPARARLAVPALLAAVAAAAGAAPLTAPYRDETAAAADSAAYAILAVALAGLVLGAAYALLDRRVALPPRATAVAHALLALGAAVAAATIALVLVRDGGDLWRSFTTYHPAASDTHLATLGGSNRYDFWRVAAGAALDHPVAGIGARGFGARYLLEGDSPETPARAHSVVLDTAAELGLPGVLLLVAALGVPLVAVARAARGRALHATAALGACTGWLVHAGVDWTWTFPAAGIPFFLLLGTGLATGAAALRAPRSTVGAAAALVAAVALFAPPWLAARLTGRAATGAADGGRLELARRLDPLAVDPLYVRAALAPDGAARIAALAEARDLQPRSVAARYQLGVALADAGRRDEALAELDAAAALDPGNPLVEAARARAAGLSAS